MLGFMPGFQTADSEAPYIRSAASDCEDAFAAVSCDAPRIVLALRLTHARSLDLPRVTSPTA